MDNSSNTNTISQISYTDLFKTGLSGASGNNKQDWVHITKQKTAQASACAVFVIFSYSAIHPIF